MAGTTPLSLPKHAQKVLRYGTSAVLNSKKGYDTIWKTKDYFVEKWKLHTRVCGNGGAYEQDGCNAFPQKKDSAINVKVEFGEGEGKVPLEKYGFKVHTAYIAEVKRDLGLPMYDAPNAVEEMKQPRKHLTGRKLKLSKLH